MIIKNRSTIDTGSYSEGGLNILEKFCVFVLPLGLGGMIYGILSEVTGLIWWGNLIIAFSIWLVLVILIFLLSWWMAENDILRY
jgi:Na+/citrate or Na+/malate symporter